MSLAGVLTGFATGTYTVTRRPAAGHVEGRRAPPVPESLQVKASVQPLSGRELERLPEGLQNREVRVIFTSVELLAGGGDDGYEPDLVAIDGSTWQVEKTEAWDQLGGLYRSYIARV